MFVYGKCSGLAKITGAIEIQYLSFLWRANSGPRVGWRVCVEWLLAVPDQWKITSANPNVEWLLSGGGHYDLGSWSLGLKAHKLGWSL